jgi:hypothetical protein
LGCLWDDISVFMTERQNRNLRVYGLMTGVQTLLSILFPLHSRMVMPGLGMFVLMEIMVWVYCYCITITILLLLSGIVTPDCLDIARFCGEVLD